MALSHTHAKIDADQSARLLAEKLRNHEQFFYLRYGDGAIECIHGLGTRTCDGELYSQALGDELLDCWNSVLRSPNTFVGDWQSASFGPASPSPPYSDLYQRMIGERQLNWLHFEALLMMRESEELVDFYSAVAADRRRKLLMGPADIRPAAQMLGADFLAVPVKPCLFEDRHWILEKLLAKDFDVLLYGAGMAGNIPAVRCWEAHPDRTFVNLGSALDPLFRGRTRRQQIPFARAMEMFSRATEGVTR